MSDMLTWAPSPAGKGVVAVAALLLGGFLGFVVGQEASGPDVSQDGQIAMACALAEKVKAGAASADDWGPLDDNNSYNEVDAIPGLLGVAAPQNDERAEEFGDIWVSSAENWDTSLGSIFDKKLTATIDKCDDW